MKTITRIILFVFAAGFFTGCGSDELSNDVWILSQDKEFRDGKFIIRENVQPIRFSKKFWSYFIQSHPRSAAVLFLNHLNVDQPFTTSDPSRLFFAPGIFHGHLFSDLLADRPGEPEKEGWVSASFFVINKNASSGGEVITQPPRKKLAKRQQREFELLKEILTGAHPTEQYVIVYKKSFLDH